MRLGRGQWWSGSVAADMLEPEETRAALQDPWSCEGLWERYVVHWAEPPVCALPYASGSLKPSQTPQCIPCCLSVSNVLPRCQIWLEAGKAHTIIFLIPNSVLCQSAACY